MLSISLSLWLLVAIGLGAAQDRPQQHVGGANDDRVLVKTHSLGPPYLDSEMQCRWFDFGGDAIVRADKYVRLAADMTSRAGWLSSKIPLTASNWQIEVEFKIHGQGNLHGDGMAMWITKDRATQGPVFGSKDKFEGLGIFFDTYKNNRPGTVFPLVMAMLGDGKTSYDKETDGRDQELASCSARGLRGANVPTKARLTYYQDEMLKLELQYKAEAEWTPCFELGAVEIPSVSYLGFSAETGELHDNFDIIRLETYNLYSSAPARPEASGKTEAIKPSKPSKQSKPAKPKKEKSSAKANDAQSSSGWGWAFVKFLLFLIVCGGGYIGWTIYRTSKRSRFD